MKSIFSKSGLQVLNDLPGTGTLYAFDFDGTLAPIVNEPTRANCGATTLKYLDRLTTLAPTAVISGRSVSDLKTRFSFHPRFLIGNHGLEGLPNEPSLKPLEQVCMRWKKQLADEPLLSAETGCFLEDKRYSLAIHYRGAKMARVKGILTSMSSGLRPSPRLILGKSVINLIPNGGPHKGVALLELMRLSGSERAVYLGDDDTDEDVFAVPDSRIVKIRIGRKQGSQATYYLDRQSQINKFLRLILGNLPVIKPRFKSKKGTANLA